jgi:hypothetical protein
MFESFDLEPSPPPLISSNRAHTLPSFASPPSLPVSLPTCFHPLCPRTRTSEAIGDQMGQAIWTDMRYDHFGTARGSSWAVLVLRYKPIGRHEHNQHPQIEKSSRTHLRIGKTHRVFGFRVSIAISKHDPFKTSRAMLGLKLWPTDEHDAIHYLSVSCLGLITSARPIGHVYQRHLCTPTCLALRRTLLIVGEPRLRPPPSAHVVVR